FAPPLRFVSWGVSRSPSPKRKRDAKEHSQELDMVTAVRAPQPVDVEAKRSRDPIHAPRLVSVDVLRALGMLTMALDHVGDFMPSQRFAPEDLTHTFGALFFTRFITHYCAPVFSFLAGTGAFLATQRGKSTQQLSWFFFTRGLWLVLLELTIV